MIWVATAAAHPSECAGKHVPYPTVALLQVELCQVGPHGDLVVGSCQVAMWGLTGAGTSVQWLTLNNAAAAPGGRLCMVFRYAANPGEGSLCEVAHWPTCRSSAG